MKILSIIWVLGLFANPTYSQNSYIKDFLSKASSFDVKFDTLNNPFILHRIEVTSNSLIIDDKEMIEPSYQDIYTVDSFVSTLLKLKSGRLIKMEKGADIEYFKVIKTDSILCMRFATIGIPLTNDINIDSIYTEILKQLEKGIHWNNLKYHPTEDNKPIKGTSGWIRSGELLEEFRTAFLNHKIGDIFIVKSPQLKFGWIVYKTNNEKLFERKQILFATNRKL